MASSPEHEHGVLSVPPTFSAMLRRVSMMPAAYAHGYNSQAATFLKSEDDSQNDMFDAHHSVINNHSQIADAATAQFSGQALGLHHLQPAKKKRGRPRKYCDGANDKALLGFPRRPSALSSVSSSTGKRRGRPPGTGKKQQLATLGVWLAGTAGQGFTPHIITIAAGEDVASRIMSFSQVGPRAVCVLSANGAISNVTLRQPATSGGTATYEGRFEILSLSGSFLLTEDGGTRSRTGGLSVSLAGPDGYVIGGGVAGMLMAASPVQVVVGSFIAERRKAPAQIASGTFEHPAGLSVASGVAVNSRKTLTKMAGTFSPKSSSYTVDESAGGADNGSPSTR